MTVEERIAQYLADNDKKRTGVAAKAGISKNRFSNILLGRTHMRVDELERICLVLNEDPGKFVAPEKFGKTE